MVVGFSYFFIPIVIFGEPASSLFGAFIMGAVLFFVAGIALYYFYRILILPLHLSQYSFKIYDLDPRNSEIIENISNLITAFVYIVAAFMAVTTATLVLIGWTALPAMAPTILIAWVLIIALFVTNHYALNKIITKAKWKTLNEIQKQIEQMYTAGNLAEKEKIESINRLMDYHDRIKGTPNSALDFRAGLSFANSLLLPLLAFLLANMKGLIELVHK